MIKKVKKIKDHLNIKLKLTKDNIQELYLLYNNLKSNYPRNEIKCLETQKNMEPLVKIKKIHRLFYF